MKFRLIYLLLILLLFSIFVPAQVQAQEMDYVANAVAALQTSNIYVAPGTSGTDYDTASKLKKLLTDSDRIVLVMLPADALTGSDMYSIAQKISAGLDNQKTIGLAVGDELIGYSPVLLEGVANDKMDRASTVASDPVTALTIFTQNIHTWQTYNPQATPEPTPEPTPTPRPTMEPIELPKAKDIGWPIWTCFGIFLVLFFAFLSKTISNGVKEARVEAKRQERQDRLEVMRQDIQKIDTDVSKITNRKIRVDLDGAILLADGLIDILEESNTYIGMTESLTPEMIKNMGKQVKAYLRHESGRRPIPESLLTNLVEALLNYDALFKTLQADDPDGAELLASVIHSQTTMISRNGYLED